MLVECGRNLLNEVEPKVEDRASERASQPATWLTRSSREMINKQVTNSIPMNRRQREIQEACLCSRSEDAAKV